MTTISEDEVELDQLIKETMNKQQLSKSDKAKEEAVKRAEYDSITEGLSEIHYHLSLCVFLIILALLNLPSVLSWAKNTKYKYLIY